MSVQERQRYELFVKTKERIKKDFPALFGVFDELEGPEIRKKSVQKENCLFCPKKSFFEIIWKNKGRPDSISQIRCCGNQECAIESSVVGAVSQLPFVPQKRSQDLF